MANRTNRRSNVPTLDYAPPRTVMLDDPRTGREGSGAFALADTFKGLGQKVSALADEAVIREAEAQGARAGLSPSFDPQVLFKEGTLRAQAFDRAAARSYQVQLDRNVRSDVDQAVEEFGHAPEQLKGRLDQIRQGYTTNLPPQLLPAFEGRFLSFEHAEMSAALARNEKLRLAEERAEILPAIEALRKDMIGLAFKGGDPETVAAGLATQMEAFKNRLIEYGPREAFTLGGVEYEADAGRAGLLGPDEIVSEISEAEQVAATAQVLGRVETMASSAQVEAYRAQVISEQRELGAQSPFSPAALSRLDNALSSQASAKRAEERRAAAEIAADLRDLQSLVEAGFAIDPDRIAEVSRAARVLGDRGLVEDAADLRQHNSIAAAARQGSPTQLMAEIEAEREAAGDQVTLSQARSIAVKEKVLASMSRGLRDNPHAWADRAGVVPNTPLDPASEDFVAQLTARRRASDQISSYYGFKAPVLQPGEAARFATLFETGTVDERMAMMMRFNQGLGDAAGDVYAELSKQSPFLAHAGALLAQGDGAVRAVRDALVGQEAIAQGSAVEVEKIDKDDVLSETLGGALAYRPDVRGEVIEAADAIYAARATRRGAVKPGEARRMYRDALNEALGGQGDFGGLGEYRGVQLAIPPQIRRGKFEDFVQALNDQQLIDQSLNGEAPVWGSGAPFGAEALGNVWLVDAGQPGLYLLSATDPSKTVPRFVLSGEVGAMQNYVLDLRGVGQ